MSSKKFPFMTITQTAANFEVTERTLYNWINSGRFPPPIAVGNRRYYTNEIIADFIKTLAKNN